MKTFFYLMIISVNLFGAVVSGWHMDEASWNGTSNEVVDYIGSNDGTAKNGLTTVVSGVNGRAGSFDGSDDYIELSSVLTPLQGTGSLSVWIKTTQTGDDTMWRAPGITGIEEAGGGDDVFWGWIDASGHIGMTYANESATKSTTLINDDVWHHVALTRDSSSGEVVVYVDGVEEARATRASGTVSNANTFNRLGSIEDTGGTPTFFQGTMDEVEVFDHVLTSTEVSDLYFKYHEILKPLVEYRMDECYWIDNANGLVNDVRDNSANKYDATSHNSAAVGTGTIGKAGHFTVDDDYVNTEDTTVGDTAGEISISFWLNLDAQMARYCVVLTKSASWDWDDGWGFVNPNSSSSDTLRFYIESFSGDYVDTTVTSSDGWVFITATYDGSDIILYKDGAQVGSKSVSGLSISSTDWMRMANDTAGTSNSDGTLKGYLDEVKVWDSALSAIEVKYIFDNESNGDNYDGSQRDASVCSGSTGAGGWQLIGIPAEARASIVSITFADVFEEFNAASYADSGAADGWILFKPLYDSTYNITHTNGAVALSDDVDFGSAYWLLTKQAGSWSTNGLLNVDYDVSKNSVPECQSNRCVEVKMEDVKPDDPTYGPNRYTMFGYPGEVPVKWSDCRIIVSDSDGSNAQIYTIEDASNADYISREIWFWASGSGTASDGHVLSTDYASCSDNSIPACTLLPHHGYWISTQQGALNKKVQILLPKGVDQ